MRRYHSYSEFLKQKYGERLQKISVHAGFTCPNRDGSKGYGGCTYCNNDAFVPGYTAGISLQQQIEEGIAFHRKRYRRAEKFLAYFQSYTNTYATNDQLFGMWDKMLENPIISGMVISTRPDCLNSEMVKYLERLSATKIIMVELGIESVYDKTLQRINRGHTYDETIKAVDLLKHHGLFINAHYILGLPGETRDEQVGAAELISTLPIDALKLHQLQIVRGSMMEKEYKKNPSDFELYELSSYTDLVIDFLDYLSPRVMIDRFASEVPPRYLVGPDWGMLRYDQVLGIIEERMEERGSMQGSKFNQKR